MGNGDAIMETKTRVPVGRRSSGGERTGNARNQSIQALRRECGTARDGHVRRELMIPVSIGRTALMALNSAAFAPVVNQIQYTPHEFRAFLKYRSQQQRPLRNVSLVSFSKSHSLHSLN